ncbi:hypothetical protein AJ80_02304 [Polytolypa hystricis UAMH7299]|uniref:Band 7 domain-containing protein n=1 Tax=Polytolypa hystricis (strain UAMH7299) TaxID=1447883 RepID=A0A2B7YS35_POLH7|nr:hypothetical protein AJ80_02304 [Polytolypa hystricis UAMH7299]
MLYNVSEANEYLVITGGGIKDVVIKKTAFIMPWQKCTRISISPFDFSLNLQAMTIEKLQFALPAVFTIGPDNNIEALKKYALLLTGGAASKSTSGNHVQDIVKGIIEGETRVIVSSMTMEEIFKERQVFKQHVIENVQNELDQFGLRIYNANVKELQDTPGSEYFSYLSRKAHEGALNQAKIDVAEARMRGEIGEAEKRGKTKQEISKIDAETAVLETKRRSEKAQADAQLTNRQTELDMGIRLGKITAQRQAEMKDAELQKQVETKRAETELERLRALDVTKSKIARESAQENADAAFYTEQRVADGQQYKLKIDADAQLYNQKVVADGENYLQMKQADGTMYRQKIESDAQYYRQTKEAEAMYFSRTKEAEAQFIAKQKEAEGVAEMAKAYASMADVFGGPQGFLQYLMIQNNTFERLAQANAQAINGLQPKITVWNTGSSGDGVPDTTSPMRNIMQSIPPLFSTIHDQTGIAPPTWMAQMPQPQQQSDSLVTPEQIKAKAKANANGA